MIDASTVYFAERIISGKSNGKTDERKMNWLSEALY
jgi:hypothetical protein